MSSSFSYDPVQLAEVVPVVEALTKVVSAEQIMVVGAQCRDLLHARLVGGPSLRSTNDTDVAIAMRGWEQYLQIRERFDSVGESGHRFRINGVVTDIIPFGGVEEPAGTATHPPQINPMNVHGFRDAFERADLLPILDSQQVKIPQADSYAVLKTHAWLDRSPDGEYKDAGDLALVVYWYSENTDMLYSDENFWAMERHDHDLRAAAAALLGAAMRAGLSGGEDELLRARIASADIDLLVRHFGVGRPGWPSTDRERQPLVRAFIEQF